MDEHHKSWNIAISVYMDDVIISAKQEEPLQEKAVSLKLAALKSKFALSAKKTSIVSRSIEVFNINLAHLSTKITTERLDSFRFAYQKSKCNHQKAGILNYICSINTVQAGQFLATV